MQHKKFIGVEAKNIYLITHILKDDNDKTYPQPSIISFTDGTATEIFEKNGIPKEYQKMFMVVNNNLSMAFQKTISHSINLQPAAHKFNRFKARELILGTELFVAYDSSYELSGKNRPSLPCGRGRFPRAGQGANPRQCALSWGSRSPPRGHRRRYRRKCPWCGLRRCRWHRRRGKSGRRAL